MTASTTAHRVLLALCLAGGGCAVHPRAEACEGESPLPLEATAWIAASLARDWMPGTDPLPMHAGAPVLRTDTGYLVEYRAPGPRGGAHVSLDGRWLPPSRGEQAPTFCAQPLRRSPSTWSTAVSIAVEADALGRCRWRLWGDRLPAGAADELRALLDHPTRPTNEDATPGVPRSPTSTAVSRWRRQRAAATADEPTLRRWVHDLRPGSEAGDDARWLSALASEPRCRQGGESADLWRRTARAAARSWERSMARCVEERAQRNALVDESADPATRARRAAALIRAGRLTAAAQVLRSADARGAQLMLLELEVDDLRGATGVALWMLQRGEPGASGTLAQLWAARGHADVARPSRAADRFGARVWSPRLAALTEGARSEPQTHPVEATHSGTAPVSAEQRLLERARRFFARAATASPPP